MTSDPTDIMTLNFEQDDIPWKHGREVYGLWLQKRGSRNWPSRKDITPSDMLPFLEHVMLIDVQYNPTDFVIRLSGTGYNRFIPYNPTGQRIETLANGPDIHARLQRMLELKQPYLGLDQPVAWADTQKQFKRFDGIVLPLGDTDEIINMLLLLVHYHNR